jgi:hypothetical protein|tara:strand:- start:466 stop:1077 length:612 start_codon:yes stop_codon:yes gene_type:complete
MRRLDNAIIELLERHGILNSDELSEMLSEHSRIITSPTLKAKREKIRRTIAKSDNIIRVGTTSNSFYKLASGNELKNRENIFDRANELVDSAMKNQGEVVRTREDDFEDDAFALLIRRRIIEQKGEGMYYCTGKAFTFDARKRLQTTHNIPIRINQRLIKLENQLNDLNKIPGLEMKTPETITRSAIICIALELLDLKLESAK